MVVNMTLSFFEFSMVIRQNRIMKNLTQRQMCEKLLISKTRYSNIENGILEPKFRELVLICKILDIDFTYEVIKKEAPFRPHYD